MAKKATFPVRLLEGGCEGWKAAGGELFSGVNVPGNGCRRKSAVERLGMELLSANA
jgi:3-mercaptopyruvate sulfurtransferase SseA